MQTKRGSLFEVCTGTAVAFAISMAAGQWIYPLITGGSAVSLQSNFIATGLFTLISIIRSYLWRRLFNWLGR